MNKEYRPGSVIAKYIEGLIQEKRSLGFSYVFEEYVLREFDYYCISHNLQSPAFSREFLLPWLSKQGDESSSYHSQRISFVRQLSLYMNSLGISSYIPVESVKKEVTVPFVLSNTARLAFFTELDSDCPKIPAEYAWRMWNEYRVMFRLAYCCGMRNSEICSLKVADVNFHDGFLTVFHSKGDKDRIIYLAEDMRLLLVEYQEYLLKTLQYEQPWMFPNRSVSGPISKSTFSGKFKEIWENIAVEKNEKSPTLHSLRHSYVVDRMNQWYESGVSYEQMLPYLSKYLGHSCVENTMYYYHLNEHTNALIRNNISAASNVIPGVEKYE